MCGPASWPCWAQTLNPVATRSTPRMLRRSVKKLGANSVAFEDKHRRKRGAARCKNMSLESGPFVYTADIVAAGLVVRCFQPISIPSAKYTKCPNTPNPHFSHFGNLCLLNCQTVIIFPPLSNQRLLVEFLVFPLLPPPSHLRQPTWVLEHASSLHGNSTQPTTITIYHPEAPPKQSGNFLPWDIYYLFLFHIESHAMRYNQPLSLLEHFFSNSQSHRLSNDSLPLQF